MRLRDDNKLMLLYKATIKIICDDGLAHAYLSRISLESGIPKASIYTYFKNKHEMMNTVYLMAKEVQTGEIFQGYSTQMKVKDAVFLIMRNMFTYYQNNSHMCSFFEQCSNAPIISTETKQKALIYYQPMVDLCNRGIETKVLKDCPINIFKIYMYDVIISVIKDTAVELNDAYITQIIHMSWAAMAK